MNVSPNTVKAFLRLIMTKMGVSPARRSLEILMTNRSGGSIFLLSAFSLRSPTSPFE